jgi:uncharacterized YccA/Bax inhibitor family protein
MRTSNPALNQSTFENFGDYAVERSTTMTLEGTATKTAMLVVLLSASAGFVWSELRTTGGFAGVMPYVVGGLVAALISGLVMCFRPQASAILAPVYAVGEGAVMGAISAAYETQYHGIVFQAICLTLGTLFSLLTAYRTGIIKATENFKLGIFAATGGIGMLYLVSMLMNMFGYRMPFLHSNGLIGIGINVVVVIVAALNLVLDFDFIEEGAKRGAPKYMEWYAGYGLLVTLVWLYVEFLRLLSKLNSRD